MYNKFTVLSDAADCLLWKLVVEMVFFKVPALCSLLSVSLVFVRGKVPAAIFSAGDILVECVAKLSVLEWCRFFPWSLSWTAARILSWWISRLAARLIVRAPSWDSLVILSPLEMWDQWWLGPGCWMTSQWCILCWSLSQKSLHHSLELPSFILPTLRDLCCSQFHSVTTKGFKGSINFKKKTFCVFLVRPCVVIKTCSLQGPLLHLLFTMQGELWSIFGKIGAIIVGTPFIQWMFSNFGKIGTLKSLWSNVSVGVFFFCLVRRTWEACRFPNVSF